jgi:hypothetical protein
MLNLLKIFFTLLLTSKTWRSLKTEKCYGTNFCERNSAQNKIKPESLSRMTCVSESNNQLNFTMGTNKPVFKSDGESPARIVYLDPFCMDQTEVSNLQFSQFVQETKYITEVQTKDLFNLGDFMFYQE